MPEVNIDPFFAAVAQVIDVVSRPLLELLWSKGKIDGIDFCRLSARECLARSVFLRRYAAMKRAIDESRFSACFRFVEQYYDPEDGPPDIEDADEIEMTIISVPPEFAAALPRSTASR